MGIFSKFMELLGFQNSDSQYAERRAHERIPVRVGAQIEQDQIRCPLVILDISQGGVKVELETLEGLNLKAPLFLIAVSGEKMYRVQFELVWVQGNKLGLRVVDWEDWLQYFYELTKTN
jgi:hypothetical protein